MYRAAFRARSGFPLVLAAGLAVGAFSSRFLSEIAYSHLGVLRLWTVSAAVMALTAMAAVLGWLFLWRRVSPRQRSSSPLPYLLPLLLLTVYLFQQEVDTLQAYVLLFGSLSLVATLTAARLVRQEWMDKAFVALVFFVPLAIYLMTLLPTVGEHDTFEFQVLSYELGIPHPTGYPLYMLLGKLFTLLPFGNVGYRLNLSSALFAGGAAAVLYATIYLLVRHRGASVLAALSFAFSYSFWSQAVVAEVYALNALFVALVFFLLLRYGGELAAGTEPAGYRATPQATPALARWAGRVNPKLTLLAAGSFIYGLSLTHHRTMLLLLPASVIYLMLNARRIGASVRSAATLVGAFAVPLLGIHLYIPIRWWQIRGQVMSLSEFADLVLGSRFAAALHWDAWLREPDRLRIYSRILLDQYPVAALGVALLGLVWLLRPRRGAYVYPGWKEGIFLLTAFVAYVLFGLGYYVPDVSLFIIPSHLAIAVALGIGIRALIQLTEGCLARWHPISASTGSRWAKAGILSLAALIPMSLVWTNGPRVDRSGDYSLYEWGRYVLQQQLPSGAVILADSEKIAPLHYLQRVEGLRSDTETCVFSTEQANRAELERRLAEGKAVFLARFLPGLETTYHLRSLGPLVDVSRGMLRELPADVSRLDWSFGEEVLLRGYRLDSADINSTGAARLTLYWEATDHVAANYEVRLRLVGATGQVWHQTKGRPPVNGLYPTAAWQAGEIVPDFHELELQGRLPPGSYGLQVGLFKPFGEEGLAEVSTGEEYPTIAQVSVSSAGAQLPTMQHSVRADFDSRLILLGYDVPSAGYPGAEIPLTLYWQRIGPVATDYDLAIELWGSGSEVIWSKIEQPLLGEYPVSQWTDNEVLTDAHQVRIPSTASGQLRLRISLLDRTGHDAVPVLQGWLACPQRTVTLSEIMVQGLPESPNAVDYLPARFEDKILLVGYEIHNVQVRKGGALKLTLTWQALAPVAEDYTVFVHLLDENDRIWAQEDIQPVYGTRPTSQWGEGETVVDPHTVWTKEDAPLGLYRIEVGFYLLRTMERLQVLDPSGTPIGDKVVIDLMEIVP